MMETNNGIKNSGGSSLSGLSSSQGDKTGRSFRAETASNISMISGMNRSFYGAGRRNTNTPTDGGFTDRSCMVSEMSGVTPILSGFAKNQNYYDFDESDSSESEMFVNDRKKFPKEEIKVEKIMPFTRNLPEIETKNLTSPRTSI